MSKKKEFDWQQKPQHHPQIAWQIDKTGQVVLEVENKGWANRLAQWLFRRPKVSYIHLDEMGTFVWPLLNGERTLQEIAGLVEEQFGEKAQPLYPRLSQYIRILESYGFLQKQEK